MLSDWGGKTLLYIPGWVVFGTTQRQAWQWSVEALREIARSAAGVGVQLVIEPTSFDSNLVDRCDDAIMMMEDVDEPNVKLMFDTFHVLYRREVSSDYVYKMGKNWRICISRTTTGCRLEKVEATSFRSCAR